MTELPDIPEDNIEDKPSEVPDIPEDNIEDKPSDELDNELDPGGLTPNGEIDYSMYLDNVCTSEMETGALTWTIREMIGTPNCGFEYLEYGIAGAVFIILFALVASVFVGFSKFLGAR